MYYIIEAKSKQYKVNVGDVLQVDFIDKNKGETYDDLKVLMYRNKDQCKIGSPYIDGAKVKAVVEEQKKDPKILSVRYKPKTGSKKVRGHRQKKTSIKIESIEGV